MAWLLPGESHPAMDGRAGSSGISHPYVRPGMTVLEPGPGMGFFTLPMAQQLAGPSGRVIAVDIQAKMLDSLRHRALKASLLSRIETRLTTPDSLGVADLREKVGFVLAYGMVHEAPSPESLFQETAATLKPGGQLLLVEPAGHVRPAKLESELEFARKAGLTEIERPETLPPSSPNRDSRISLLGV